MVFIVFLAFFKMQVIHVLKPLAWKSRDLLTDQIIETAIYWNFYSLSFNFTFETNPSQLQPYVQGVSFSLQYFY